MRRSSSVQLPLRANKPDELKLQNSVLKDLQAEASGGNSTISVALGGSSLLNLYPSMARYRCCCGLCRLRTAALTVSSICLIISFVAITTYWFYGTKLAMVHSGYVGVPVTVTCAYQVFACICLQIGVLLEMHLLILPFLINCVVAMMSSMGIGMILLVSTDRKLTRVYPLFAAVSMLIVAVYLYFLVITCMTFIMFRDKQRCTNGCDMNLISTNSTNITFFNRFQKYIGQLRRSASI